MCHSQPCVGLRNPLEMIKVGDPLIFFFVSPIRCILDVPKQHWCYFPKFEAWTSSSKLDIAWSVHIINWKSSDCIANAASLCLATSDVRKVVICYGCLSTRSLLIRSLWMVLCTESSNFSSTDYSLLLWISFILNYLLCYVTSESDWIWRKHLAR